MLRVLWEAGDCPERDDSPSEDSNQGNSKALVQLRIDAGDLALKSHLETCSKRSTYMSKTTQNELLACVGEFFVNEIAAEMHPNSETSSCFFGVQADEVTDTSNW